MTDEDLQLFSIWMKSPLLYEEGCETVGFIANCKLGSLTFYFRNPGEMVCVDFRSTLVELPDIAISFRCTSLEKVDLDDGILISFIEELNESLFKRLLIVVTPNGYVRKLSYSTGFPRNYGQM